MDNVIDLREPKDESSETDVICEQLKSRMSKLNDANVTMSSHIKKLIDARDELVALNTLSGSHIELSGPDSRDIVYINGKDAGEDYDIIMAAVRRIAERRYNRLVAEASEILANIY